MSCYAYLVRCADGTLYTGCTNDLDRRLRAHQAGRGAKYTRSRLPVELVYRELGLAGTGGSGDATQIDASETYVRALTVIAKLLERQTPAP